MTLVRCPLSMFCSHGTFPRIYHKVKSKTNVPFSLGGVEHKTVFQIESEPASPDPSTA